MRQREMDTLFMVDLEAVEESNRQKRQRKREYIGMMILAPLGFTAWLVLYALIAR